MREILAFTLALFLLLPAFVHARTNVHPVHPDRPDHRDGLRVDYPQRTVYLGAYLRGGNGGNDDIPEPPPPGDDVTPI